MRLRKTNTSQFGPAPSPAPVYIQQATAPAPPAVDPISQDKAETAANKARKARSNAAGSKSTILTSGLGVLGAANTQSNSTLG